VNPPQTSSILSEDFKKAETAGLFTIFACPRAFDGHYGVIQWNAIKSWTLLNPRPSILLLGNDAGTQEIAKELNVEYIPEIERNNFGTPLVSDLFLKAEKHSSSPLLTYVNADIILMDDFTESVKQVHALKRPFLLVGQRWDFNLNERLDFKRGWEERLRDQVRREGHARGPTGIDYFVFPRGLWPSIPPFALGRFTWDVWLLSKARMSTTCVIDASTYVMAVHQNHQYAHSQGERGVVWGPEAQQNRKFFTGTQMYTLDDATHRLTQNGVHLSWGGLLRIPRMKLRLHHLWYDQIWFPILSWTRPLRRKLSFENPPDAKPVNARKTAVSNLTIFACPRAFEGHFATIQSNAIRSWASLSPRPEILLLGNDRGTAEIAKELGLRHIPEIECNRFGTPLVSDLFLKAEQNACTSLLAYVNADIILMNDFMDAVLKMARLKKKFLLAGPRWNLDIQEKLAFQKDWDTALKTAVLKQGLLQGPGGIDYFVFPHGLWGEIPPFALGRGYWDNWLLYRARAMKAMTIDGTEAVMAIHQNHQYPNDRSLVEILQDSEALENLKYAERSRYGYTLKDSTHRLTQEGLKLWLPGILRHPAAAIPALQWLEDHVWVPLLEITRPLRHLANFRIKTGNK